MDPESVARIDARLSDIERDHAAAIESGSRAWGFPSADSDYDCRFLFVRARDEYLSLFAKRDVIETPLQDELDVNGWDVAKAIRLLLKGNAVVIEWLTSPIVYRGDAWFAETFLALARHVADRAAIARHYLHLGERQRRTYFADGKSVPLKKIFYALRPAAALRWLCAHPQEAVAPMHFSTLLAQCDAPRAVVDLTAQLIARKAQTRELGEGPLPAPVAAFIDSEFTAARNAFGDSAGETTAEARALAQQFFLDVLSRIASCATP
jgi:hypothetical protein